MAEAGVAEFVGEDAASRARAHPGAEADRARHGVIAPARAADPFDDAHPLLVGEAEKVLHGPPPRAGLSLRGGSPAYS